MFFNSGTTGNNIASRAISVTVNNTDIKLPSYANNAYNLVKTGVEIGGESSLDVGLQASSTVDSDKRGGDYVNRVVETGLRGVGFEPIELRIKNPIAYDAGLLAALMASNPKLAYSRDFSDAFSMSSVKTVGGVDGATAYGWKDLHMGGESFDGQNFNASVMMSFMATYDSYVEDEVANTLFKPIPIDPIVGTVHRELSIYLITNEHIRNYSGVYPARRNILRYVNDPASLINESKNELEPVVSVDTAPYIVSAFSYITTVSGESKTTAPLIFDKDIPFIEVCTPSNVISRGSKTDSNKLDKNIRLRKLFLAFSNGTISEKFDVDVLGFDEAKALPKRVGVTSVQEIIFEKEIGISTSKKMLDGSASTLLAGLSLPNYKIIVKLGVMITIYHTNDTIKGSVTGKPTLVKLVDAVGDSITAGATFDAVKAIIEHTDSKIAGFAPAARELNVNVSNIDDIITTEEIQEVYGTRITQPNVTIKGAIYDNYGTNSDLQKVTSIALLNRLRRSGIMYSSLLDYRRLLKNTLANYGELTTENITGLSRYLIKPYYKETTVSIHDILMTQNSAEKPTDIASALGLFLKEILIVMDRDTLIGNIAKSVFNRQESEYAVLCGWDIHAYMPTDPYVTSDIKIKVLKAATDDFKTILCIVPITSGSTLAGQDYDPLQFGEAYIGPDIMTDVVKTNGNGVSRYIISQPQVGYNPCVPVMHWVTFTGVEDLSDKTAINFRQV